MTDTIARHNFSIKQGNSGTLQNAKGIELNVKNEDGSAVDLSGWDIVFFARYGSDVLRLSSSAGEMSVEASTGSICVPISVAHSRLFRANTNVRYEVERRKEGAQRIIIEGQLHIIEGINDD